MLASTRFVKYSRDPSLETAQNRHSQFSLKPEAGEVSGVYMALRRYASSTKSQWQKTPSTVYETNYGYGMNFYQPMSEYLDDKRIGGRVELPHLSYTNERGLEQYSPRKLVRSYTEKDLQKLRHEARESARDVRLGLEHLRPPGASNYSLQKSFSSSAFQKMHVEVRRKKKKSRKEENIVTIPDFDYDPEADKQAEFALKKIKKQLRGKTAHTIEQVLLRESRDFINNENTLKNIDINVQEQQTSAHDSRAHMRMMESRICEQLNDSFMQPLENLSKDLHGFNRKTTHNLQSQRLLNLVIYLI